MTKIYEKTYENGRKKIRFLGIKISYKDNKIKYSPLHTDKTKAPIRIAFYVGCEDNRSERYRVDNIVEELTNCGIIADRYYPGSLDELKKSTNYDLLVIFRVGEFNRPLFPKIVDTIKIFQKHNIPIIYDVDDYLFSNRIPEEIQNDVQEIIENANAITVTTNALKIKYQKFCNNVQIIKNTINFHQMQLASKTVKRKKHNTMKIVYQSGHASHTYDFTACEKALINIMKKYKNVEFHLISQHTSAIPVLYLPSVLYVPDSHTPLPLVVTVQYPHNSVPNALNIASSGHTADCFWRNYYSVLKCFADFSDYCRAFAPRSFF